MPVTVILRVFLRHPIFMTAGFCLYGQIVCASRCTDFALYATCASAAALKSYTISLNSAPLLV